jgi:O-6-methylguanine DNA methyltransferase
MIFQQHIKTPLGNMLACAIDEGLCLLEFADRPMLPEQMLRIEKYFGKEMKEAPHPIIKKTEQQLIEYFYEKRKQFDIHLLLNGTTFQQNVWNLLLEIPYGTTRSYMDQAIALGNPKAIRAVASANGDNRIAIIVPCHRIIGKKGEMVGYGGGVKRKQALLQIESKQGHLF